MPALNYAVDKGQSPEWGKRVARIAANEVNQVTASPCWLSHIHVAEVGIAFTLAIHDDQDSADAGKLIFSWVTADGKGVFDIKIPMREGMHIVTTGAGGLIHVVWSK